MNISPGDTFQTCVLRENPDSGEARMEPLAGHLLTVLAVDGETVRYQRPGSEASDTTLAILRGSIERGDLVKVPHD